MSDEGATRRRGRFSSTGGRGVFSPLFLAVTAALSGFALWVWITGPGTSVPLALIGFVIAVICGRLAFSIIAKPAEDDLEVPTHYSDLPPDAPPTTPDGAAGPDAMTEEPRGADAPPVPEGTPPTLDGAVVDPPPSPSTVIPFPTRETQRHPGATP